MTKKKKPITQDTELDPEIAQAHRELEQVEKFPVEKVILGGFTGFAVILLLVAGIASSNNIKKINREQSTPGTVVEMVVRPQYDEEDFNRVVGEIHYPVVEFLVNDKRHTVELNEGSDPPSYAVGDDVTILYEPDNPQDARIKSFGSSALMWVLPAITGILGIGFLAAVIAVQRVMMKVT